MKTYQIPHTDLEVSRIAYGCAMLGGWNPAPLGADTVASATRAVHCALDNGITLFDHANLYAFGKSEAAFGRVLQQSPGLRAKLTIQSKCGQFFPDRWQPGDPIRLDASREAIMRSVEGSLERLGIEHLDILLLHVADALVLREEVAEAFDALHASGKVRYFGVSNHNSSQIELLKKFVRQPLVVNQIHMGLAHPQAIVDGMETTLAVRSGSPELLAGAGMAGASTLDYCQLHDIQVQAWSPLRGTLFEAAADAAPRLNHTARALAAIAKDRNTTPAAIALAWLLQHPARIVPVLGASNPAHIADNCAADGIVLSRQEWYSLFACAADIESRISE